MTTPLLALMIAMNLAAADMTGVWTFNMNDFSGHRRWRVVNPDDGKEMSDGWDVNWVNGPPTKADLGKTADIRR